MPSKVIGVYDIEYAGVHLADDSGWAAHLTVYGPSANPMHRNTVFPDQRVATDRCFATQQEAEQAALQVATDMLPTPATE